MPALLRPEKLDPAQCAHAAREIHGLFAPTSEELARLQDSILWVEQAIGPDFQGAEFINGQCTPEQARNLDQIAPGLASILFTLSRLNDQEHEIQNFTLNRTAAGMWVPPHRDEGQFTVARAATVECTDAAIFRIHESEDAPYGPPLQKFPVRTGDIVDLDSATQPVHSVENTSGSSRISVATQF